ncbi:carnitine O-palmitoyltransferase 2, mitochondrial [Episyrphus balteatus]|uniref:carnitine O-palmitoyltransferase 2, mitochondrial n=1 Tax=Episyrphus balteatus TaxID=286459 RepID=UPI00248605B7|nr:carnitine O-palmitoyltransferase 2, mitochondrial [Episyrphus balteatus]
MISHLGNATVATAAGSKFSGGAAVAKRLQLLQPNRFKTTTSSQDNYQYLHKSKLPTLYFQKSLPRLPIPELEKTCQRYLAAVEPILSPESLQTTKSIVSKFSSGTGQQLQELLKKSDTTNKHTSYISQPWFDMYLTDRSPLPVNYNPLLVMKYDSRPEYNNQLIRASNLVISSLRFMRSLQANYLEPEVFHMNPSKSDNDRFRQITSLAPTAVATYVAYAFKAFPLDMSQYSRLFGVTRIPQIGKDRIYQTNDGEGSRHILVIRGGKYFAVEVINDDGEIIPANHILGRLKVVMEQNPSGEILDNQPLGLMTAANRDAWAKTRQYVIDIGHSKQMELIDSALFCLSLDSDEIKYEEAEPQKLIKDFLAGSGINRWFDKSITLIVGGDGTAAVNFEHSWGDGVAVLRYFNEIYKDSTEKPHIHPSTIPYLPQNGDNSVRSIDFQLDDRILDDISKTKQHHNKTMDSLDIDVLRFTNGINKKSCKRSGVSPDSVMQLAFQLAYKQAFGKYVGTYESCSTAAFRHGRTETMRPCTMATKAFCDSVLASDNQHKPDDAALRAMINKCSIVHGQLTKDAAMGQGFDRHLFGLRHVAQLNGIDVTDLYNDEAYKKINYNIISTSTLSSPSVLLGSFGPVVTDGLGIGYTIQDDECGAIATTYKGQCNGSMFIDSLNEAFTKIRDILETEKTS